MKISLFSICLFFPIIAFSQKPDTIITMRGKLIGNVTEITPDLVAYTNPNESVVYKIEKGAVASIKFGSGRVEKFAELKSLANLQGAYDWAKVDVATTDYETKGLYKIDLVSTKATGTTVYSSVSRVQNRAINKLKMATALLGGNLVYIKSESLEGNIRSNQGGRTSRSQILGTVYCSQLVDTVEFKEMLAGGNEFTIVSKIGLRNNDADIHTFVSNNEPVVINSYSIEKGFIFLRLSIRRKKMDQDFRVLSFSDNRIVVSYKEGTAIYNLLLTER